MRRAGRNRLRLVPKRPTRARRRQPFLWKRSERRARRRRAFGFWAGRVAVFGPVLFVVLFRVAEIATGYTTPATGCRVTGVVDGDTVRLSCPGREENRGRLVGFDTPEVFSPQCASEWRRGVAATAYLRRAIWTADEIETRIRGTDRYGRLLVALYLDGENIAARMVASGHARVYHGGARTGWCE
jgi:micrococcal nuclease